MAFSDLVRIETDTPILYFNTNPILLLDHLDSHLHALTVATSIREALLDDAEDHRIVFHTPSAYFDLIRETNR